MRVLQDLLLNRGVKSLYNDLEMPVFPDMVSQSMQNHFLRNTGCIHIPKAVFSHTLHCRACPVSLPTAESCV